MGIDAALFTGDHDRVEFIASETREVCDGPDESSRRFRSNEVAVGHVFSRTVRRCFLLGDDPISSKNFDHRKRWIEEYLQQFAANFGIGLLCYSLLSNHFHLILRSRPVVVATWDDEDVARRNSFPRRSHHTRTGKSMPLSLPRCDASCTSKCSVASVQSETVSGFLDQRYSLS